jgi:hypothetical protein
VDDVRAVAVEWTAGSVVLEPGMLPDDVLNPFIQGYVDTLQTIVEQENA